MIRLIRKSNFGEAMQWDGTIACADSIKSAFDDTEQSFDYGVNTNDTIFGFCVTDPVLKSKTTPIGVGDWVVKEDGWISVYKDDYVQEHFLRF